MAALVLVATGQVARGWRPRERQLQPLLGQVMQDGLADVRRLGGPSLQPGHRLVRRVRGEFIGRLDSGA